MLFFVMNLREITVFLRCFFIVFYRVLVYDRVNKEKTFSACFRRPLPDIFLP